MPTGAARTRSSRFWTLCQPPELPASLTRFVAGVAAVRCGAESYNTWGAAVTGGNMEPLRARMDFEFGALPEGFGVEVTGVVNAEIAADRPAGRTAGRRPSALRAASAVTTGGYGETAGACRKGQR